MAIPTAELVYGEYERFAAATATGNSWASVAASGGSVRVRHHSESGRVRQVEKCASEVECAFAPVSEATAASSATRAYPHAG